MGELLRRDFEAIRAMLYDAAGIALGDGKRTLVAARLRRRLTALGLDDYASYVEQLRRHDHDGAERMEMVNALTTNLTAFFRERHHFELLRERIVPSLIARRGRERTLRIWSAGCSTGEEPYAIAMTLAAMPELVGWDLRVLATDIDTDVLATAEAGVYAASAVESVPKAMRARFLEPHGSRYRVHDELRSIVRFRRLNLNGESWPMRRPFDVVFCRNVTIYFDLPTQERLYQRLHARLAADGTLFAGHSENLVSMRHLFEPIGVTTYRRVERAGAEPLAAGEAIEAATEASTEAATEAGTSELLAPPAIGSAALDDRLVVCLFEREGGRGALVALPLAQPRRTSVARVLETIERLIGSLEVAGGERPLAAKLVVGPSRARSRARHVSEEVERGLARVSVPVIARREVELRGATLRFDPATTRCRLLGDATIGAVEATRRAS